MGPILLALIGTTTARNLVAVVVAGAGVYVLTDVRIEGDPAAFAWAFANAGLFTLYVILAHRVSRALFVAMLPATAVIIGIIVLHQIPLAAESVGEALVMLGVLIHRESDESHSGGD